MSKSNTQQVSEFIESIRYEDFPPEVIEQVKRLTIHTIGVSIAAAPIEQAQNAIRLSEEKGGKPEATIWGGNGQKVPAEDAAFSNATLADILDWEDCSWTGHPSAGVIAAAYAVAEGLGTSGKDYITAVVTGYEGYQRVAMAVQPSREYYQNHSWGLSSWQIFGSQIAAAKLYGLDAKKINQSFGAAVYAAPGPLGLHAGAEKSDVYHFAHGIDAYNGIFASKLARAGIENGTDYLDGPRGYWSLVSDRNDESWYLRDAGSRWLILETYIKHWPANMWVQTPLELLDAIYKEHPFTADKVKEIRLSPVTTLTALDYSKTPRTTLDAQFNASFCLAAYILNPDLQAGWFTADQLNRKELIALAAKVKEVGETLTPTDHFDVFKTGSFPEMSLEIDLKDGTVLSKTLRYPKGHPKNNTTLEEEYALFRKITAPFIGGEKAENFIKAIDDLENLENLAEASKNLVR